MGGAIKRVEDLATRDVVAATLWGEARGDGLAGMLAVANVIGNRAAKPGWWGRDARSVCLAPKQFSCWNLDDPNRAKMLATPSSDRAYTLALVLADELLGGRLRDVTARANHYHALGIRPSWIAGATPVAEIGGHVFYRLT